MEIGKLIGMSVKNNSPNMLINFYPEKKDASQQGSNPCQIYIGQTSVRTGNVNDRTLNKEIE